MFTPLSTIPQLLKGRGMRETFALKHDCGAQFLWRHVTDPRAVRCPQCHAVEDLTVDAPILDGSRM